MTDTSVSSSADYMEKTVNAPNDSSNDGTVPDLIPIDKNIKKPSQAPIIEVSDENDD